MLRLGLRTVEEMLVDRPKDLGLRDFPWRPKPCQASCIGLERVLLFLGQEGLCGLVCSAAIMIEEC